MFPTVDLCRGVNGQPLYVMACHVGGGGGGGGGDDSPKNRFPDPDDPTAAKAHPCTARAVFNFELWHKDLLKLAP
jgi:hypothetical protein